MKKLLFLILLNFLWVQPVTACAVCYGDVDSLATKAMNLGIITLLIILGSVMGLFIKFLLSFRRRARELA